MAGIEKNGTVIKVSWPDDGCSFAGFLTISHIHTNTNMTICKRKDIDFGEKGTFAFNKT